MVIKVVAVMVAMTRVMRLRLPFVLPKLKFPLLSTWHVGGTRAIFFQRGYARHLWLEAHARLDTCFPLDNPCALDFLCPLPFTASITMAKSMDLIRRTTHPLSGALCMER